jgi:WD40 repeat protein
MLYLVDATAFSGGRTRFYASNAPAARVLQTITPVAGSAVIFDHALWHDGEAVTGGTKVVLRTDVMYRPVADAGVRRGHAGYVWALAALPDGGLVSASRDRSLIRWHQGRPMARLEGHEASVLAVAAHPSGALVSASRDRTVRWWPVSEATPSTVIARHHGAVLGVCVLADGTIASSCADGVIQRSAADGTSIATLRGHVGWIWQVVPTAEGLLSIGEDGTLRRWDLGTERARAFDLGHPLRAVATDGAASWVGDDQGRIHRLRGDAVVSSTPRHAGAVTAIAARGDGLLASSGEDGLVLVSDGDDRICFRQQHPDQVRAVAWLGDGSLAAAGYDGEVRCWSLRARSKMTPAFSDVAAREP